MIRAAVACIVVGASCCEASTGGRTLAAHTRKVSNRLGNPEQSRARKERFLRRQAEQLGFTLTPVEGEVS